MMPLGARSLASSALLPTALLALAACGGVGDADRARDSALVTLASFTPAQVTLSDADRATLDSMRQVKGAIEAVLDSVHHAIRQASRERAAPPVRFDEVAMLRNETGRLALAVVSLRDSLLAMRRPTDAANGQELALAAAAQHSAALERLQQILAQRDARLDSLAAEAASMRDSLASTRGESARLVRQLDSLSANLAAARGEVEILQSEVMRLTGQVQEMDDDAHQVVACVGTTDELRKRGVIERRGGVRGAFAAWAVRRGANFDDCRDRFDWRELQTVPLRGARNAQEAAQFEVLSAHDPSLLSAERIEDRDARYGLVVRSPARFWTAGQVLVVRVR